MELVASLVGRPILKSKIQDIQILFSFFLNLSWILGKRKVGVGTGRCPDESFSSPALELRDFYTFHQDFLVSFMDKSYR